MTDLKLDPNAADLLAYWDAARGDAALPHRRSIDPIKLRPWVGDISIIRLHDGPKRFFVSLHGSNVVRHLGPDFHKQYLEDAIPLASQRDAFEPYLHGIKTGEPTYSIQRASLENGLFKGLERMVLPFCDEKPDVVERFLVWVAPITSNSSTSTSIFEPFDKSELDPSGQSSPNMKNEMFVLSDAHRKAL